MERRRGWRLSIAIARIEDAATAQIGAQRQVTRIAITHHGRLAIAHHRWFSVTHHAWFAHIAHHGSIALAFPLALHLLLSHVGSLRGHRRWR